MTETLLDPLGVEVTGVQVGAVDDDTVARWRGLLAEHGVLVLRDQLVDDAGFLAFLRRFGEPVFTVGETAVPGFPDLNVVSNVGRASAPRSSFHVDTSYVSRPPSLTALRAVTVPAEGGETLFSDQYRAYETLSPALRDHLSGRTVRHAVTGVDPGDEQEHEAHHPLFRHHDVSGRTSLYLSTPERCTTISGLPDDAARALVHHLYEHSTIAANVLRHRWRPGDVVVWDNGCVLHKADHSGVVGDRVLHRGMVR
ncbi:taurine dioxygenase [Jatrophihabitans endophyticus]|uniref:Taurine dioxygenase n=1 Tax=Jatrophihabitans endophyticus TaxID=1206085 RepID=A0A1M5U413_9ACTN|nr:TauD/TfdA family dioxygenase [Jatrophihabitans endophyticus]SHH57433.1 taurine dioxygenase [Jatrophihabitans endophyticus]